MSNSSEQQLESSPFTVETPSLPNNCPLERAPYNHTIHHGGNRYFATEVMATIFHGRAAAIVDRGETELVPLLHSAGVDLLLVGPGSPFAVVVIEVGSAR